MLTICDPEISEWGNPAGVNTGYVHLKAFFGMYRVIERTQGSEPSQYLKENKTTVIPKVVASEIGSA